MYSTPFSSLYARREVTPQQLSLDTLYFKTLKSHAKASYIHNFKTNHYQALAKGQLNPAYIDPWRGPGWQKLWSDFSFLKEQPYADIELSGNWDNEDDYFTFGKIEGTNLIFRKVFAQLCRLTLQANPKHTSMSKLYLKTTTGIAYDVQIEKASFDTTLANLNSLKGNHQTSKPDKPFHCELSGVFT